jgi:hypothetical protein
MKKTMLLLFLSVLGALLNIAFNRIAGLTVHGVQFLPLFLDTILTVSLTLTGGLFWGILCGALTNLVAHSLTFWGWEGYLFILCNVATAFITWLFVRLFPRELAFGQKAAHRRCEVPLRQDRHSVSKTVIDRMIVLILLSFALCIAMSVLGGLIAAFIQVSVTSSTARASFNFSSVILRPIMFPQGGPPLILAEILSRIPINIIDRLITAFAGYGIALALYALVRRVEPGKLAHAKAETPEFSQFSG